MPNLKEKKIKSLLADRGIATKGKKAELTKKLVAVLQEEEKQVAELKQAEQKAAKEEGR